MRITPAPGDYISHDEWNIIVLYWTGFYAFSHSGFTEPEKSRRQLEIWANEDRPPEQWHPEVIGIYTGYIEAQWTREALTDGE